MATETHIKEGIKSYLLIIGSNSSHSGKKTLNQQKRIKGEIKEDFSGRQLREEPGFALCGAVLLFSAACC